MIFYHGTHRLLPCLSYGTAATSSRMDACAWAKLKCDELGLPVTSAHIFKVDVDRSEGHRIHFREKGVQHIALRYTTIKKVYDYGDLRQLLSPEEWNVLHASSVWLKTFVDHRSTSMNGW